MTHFVTETARLLQPYTDKGVFDADTLALTDAVLAVSGSSDLHNAVLLAVALAVRAPSQGSACVDLAQIANTAAIDGAAELPWPEAIAWSAQVAEASMVVRVATAPSGGQPLVLDGTRLYLARLWAAERAVADGLIARTDGRLRVIVGGPGSGKTTRIAGDLLAELRSETPPRVALAAPTGKAAARMREAITDALRREAATPVEVERVQAARVGTLHRLLRLRPGRIHHDDMLPTQLTEDLLIVDEASMVSLPLLQHLLAAAAPHTRIWLVGDPSQLASVEVGSVLADVVSSPAAAAGGALHAVIESLTGQFRFAPDAGIARFAAAVRIGDAEAAVGVLREGRADIEWIDIDAAKGRRRVDELLGSVAAHAQLMADQASAGDVTAALASLNGLRTLCAHRDGEYGVTAWNRKIEQQLGATTSERWYAGRPLLITSNDATLDLMNGDLGVIVCSDGGVRAAFGGLSQPRLIHPVRLGAYETVHAMTIHKSQGSEFDRVVVLLPAAASRLLTRELLYTAVTRARVQVTVVGSEAALRAGVERAAGRASGLGVLLSR